MTPTDRSSFAFPGDGASSIEREPLFRQVRRVVLGRILSGDFSPGAAITVSHLAEELGVSRTPVREALLQLLREGFLEMEPNRRFTVSPLTEEEAAELYTVMHALEDLAIRLAPRARKEKLAELRRLNRRLLEVRDDPEEALAVNLRWHQTLTGDCGNAELLDLLELIRQRVYRYQFSYFSPGPDRVGMSVEEHRAVIRGLEKADLPAVRRALRDHWLANIELYLPPSLRDGAGEEGEESD